MHAVQDQIRQWVPKRFASLGADGFGFSDTRAAARRFFKIDGPSMVVRTLQALAEDGAVDRGARRAGDREVPPARRHRRHERQRGRRELTARMASRPAQMDKTETLAWLRRISGDLATATIKRLEDTLPWYAEMPPARRSAVGLVAQAGISSFIQWYDDPDLDPVDRRRHLRGRSAGAAAQRQPARRRSS